MHNSEIRRLSSKIAEKGFTVVPLKLYFKDALIKAEVGLCKGKHTYDKKQNLRDADIKRDMEREIKRYKWANKTKDKFVKVAI